MTNPISARLRDPHVFGTSTAIKAADHIDAQAATIKALVEALEKCALPCGNWNMQDLIEIAADALAAAKETPDARPVTVAEAAKVLLAEFEVIEPVNADAKQAVLTWLTNRVMSHEGGE